MGILRADRVSGLGGANAINGSVKFGNPAAAITAYDSIITEPSSDYTMGTGDFTLEGWFYLNSVVPTWQILMSDTLYGDTGGWSFYANGSQLNFWKGGASVVSGGTLTANTWHHIAYSRESGSNKIFVDGALAATASDSTNYTDNEISVGANNVDLAGSIGTYGLSGYASNVRVTKGTALYTAAFTPPTTRLEKRSDTVLLCCQSPGNVEQEATGKIIIGRGNAAASHFAPDLGEDHGTTFTDNTKFDTLSYMVPPGGRTDQRGRGRGVYAGGYVASGYLKDMYYIEIQSQGNANDFGDLNKAGNATGGGCGSATRGIHMGGTTPTSLEEIDFFTFATTSNATDFGNLEIAVGYNAALSNQTRGVCVGGRGGSPLAPTNHIQTITIASTGNATDAGDLTQSRMALGALASPTRGVIGGGYNAPASPTVNYNTIDFITLSSVGDATDFGDLVETQFFLSATSSQTRGLFSGGNNPQSVNTIQFITIASTGNSVDFGDMSDVKRLHGSVSNDIRAVFGGGMINSSPNYTNSMNFVTIATTGNGIDFGDIPRSDGFAYTAGASDSHGGIS